MGKCHHYEKMGYEKNVCQNKKESENFQVPAKKSEVKVSSHVQRMLQKRHKKAIIGR